MKAIWSAIVVLLLGLMLSSIVHNPKMLIIGLVFVSASQVMMFLAGYGLAKKRLAPSSS